MNTDTLFLLVSVLWVLYEREDFCETGFNVLEIRRVLANRDLHVHSTSLL